MLFNSNSQVVTDKLIPAQFIFAPTRIYPSLVVVVVDHRGLLILGIGGVDVELGQLSAVVVLVHRDLTAHVVKELVQVAVDIVNVLGK